MTEYKQADRESITAWGENNYACFNPHGKPVEELPIIYGFNNGGSPGWYSACLVAEDGAGLGGHLCSGECFMYGDLGILPGYRLDRHAGFQEHYPDGYRMEFVTGENVRTHEGLTKAIENNQASEGKGINRA